MKFESQRVTTRSKEVRLALIVTGVGRHIYSKGETNVMWLLNKTGTEIRKGGTLMQNFKPGITRFHPPGCGHDGLRQAKYSGGISL